MSPHPAKLTVGDETYEGIGNMGRISPGDHGGDAHEGHFQAPYPAYGVNENAPDREDQVRKKVGRGMEGVYEGYRDGRRVRSRVKTTTVETDKYTTEAESDRPKPTDHYVGLEELEFIEYLD